MSEDRTFTQEQVNEIVKERLARQASKFETDMAEFEKYKAAAEEAQTASQQKQSEVEKLSGKLEKLLAANAAAERANLVSSIARQHGINDDEDIALFLTGSDQATLAKQAERLAGRIKTETDSSQKQALIVKGEGNQSTGQSGHAPGLQTLAAELFGSK